MSKLGDKVLYLIFFSSSLVFIFFFSNWWEWASILPVATFTPIPICDTPISANISTWLICVHVCVYRHMQTVCAWERAGLCARVCRRVFCCFPVVPLLNLRLDIDEVVCVLALRRQHIINEQLVCSVVSDRSSGSPDGLTLRFVLPHKGKKEKKKKKKCLCVILCVQAIR